MRLQVYKFILFLVAVCININPQVALAEEFPLIIEHAGSYEFIRGIEKDTIFITDSAVFSHGDGIISADTAIYIKDEAIILRKNVHAVDSVYTLWADRAFYDLNTLEFRAFGKRVEIVSKSDSIMAIGPNALYLRDSTIMRMSERPSILFNYPDSARMVQIDADRVAFEAGGKVGYADGNVVINQSDTKSESGRAILHADDNILALYDNPVAQRDKSLINGDTLLFYSNDSTLKRIQVLGKAIGNFTEQSSKDSTLYDHIEMKGREVNFYLAGGKLNSIVAAGQAYSYYNPGTHDSVEVVRNIISGDTIRLHLEEEHLQAVQVTGGAEGEYITGNWQASDSVARYIEDTVFYKAEYIDYSPDDSTIVLSRDARVVNKTFSLTASRIDFQTDRELVNAYDDSVVTDTTLVYYPVILKDGSDELIGSYLEYSFDTERGLMWQTKTEYQEAYYKGKEIYRESADVYYVNNGIYIPCDSKTPNTHFWAKNMKMIRGDRVIARPVVFYIEKLPLMIFPYYVFPIDKGRHSGFLPFKFGNFEQGDRYIENVGYYWAASEYWDAQASLTYRENYGITYNSTMRYNLRYVLSGSVSGSYGTNSFYNNSFNEVKTRRWSIRFNHNHTVSPTFKIQASGNFVSDKSYYTDFSSSDEDRLNRNLRSQLAISKRLGNAQISAQFVHSLALDDESRTDEYPTASISFPSRPIFGTPDKNDPSQKKRWYHSIYLRSYRTSIRNYSRRNTLTDGTRTRREYLTVDHSTGLSVPFSLFKYFRFNVNVPYRETWYKVFRTDQSDTAGIDTKEYYRRYSYSATASLRTDLYGTANLNIFGLESLRHVLTPAVSFSWSPEITKNDLVKSYTGAGGGNSTERMVMGLSLQQIIQAKVKSGETSKKLSLLTINSSLSYDFNADERKFSNLTTSAQTTLIKNVSLFARMTHDLYKPGTNDLDLFSPYLLSMDISSSFSARGVFGQYEALSPCPDPDCDDTVSDMFDQSWDIRVKHYYRESGRGSSFAKTHTVNFSAEVVPTANWKFRYSQYYYIEGDRTVKRSLEVERRLNCWHGKFRWNIDGSNPGYGFVISLIQIPDIKFQKSESGIQSSFF